MARKVMRREIVSRPGPARAAHVRQAKAVFVIMGTPYSIDQITDLLGALKDSEREVSMNAAMVFVANYSRVVAGVNNTPNLSVTEVTELAAKVLERDGVALVRKLERSGNAEALGLLSISRVTPIKVAKKAVEALSRLPPSSHAKPHTNPAHQQAHYSHAQVVSLSRELGSEDREARIAAAVRFAMDHERIAPALVPRHAPAPQPTIAHHPVSQPATHPHAAPPPAERHPIAPAFEKFVSVVSQEYGSVLPELIRMRAPEPLRFIAMLKDIPAPVRKRASFALRLVEGGPAARKKAPFRETLAHKPEAYSVGRAAALWKDMNSPVLQKQVDAAIEFFTNHAEIAIALAKIPFLTVTEVTARAVEILAHHLQPVLGKLGKTRNMKALNFLSKSRVIPIPISRKVAELLRKLLGVE